MTLCCPFKMTEFEHSYALCNLEFWADYILACLCCIFMLSFRKIRKMDAWQSFCLPTATSEAKRRIATIFVNFVYSVSFPGDTDSVRCLSNRTAVAYGAHVGSAVLYVTWPVHGPSTARPRPVHGPSTARPRPVHGPSTARPRPVHGPSTARPRPVHGPSSARPRPVHGRQILSLKTV